MHQSYLVWDINMLDKHTSLSLIHVFLTIPLLFLIYAYIKSLQPWQCKTLLAFSILLILYFGLKTWQSVTDNAERRRLWVYLIHVVIILPVLLVISIQCQETSRKYFEMLLMIAFAGLGYHGYQLFQKVRQN